jgi:hypothetical protein
MKRERRAVQNSVDMDRAMGTGGVSKSKTSIRSRADAECRILAYPVFAVRRCTTHLTPTTHKVLDSKYTSSRPKPGSSCRYLYTPAFHIFSDNVLGARAMYTVFHEMREIREAATRYVLEAFRSNSTRHESHANKARFRRCRNGPRGGYQTAVITIVGVSSS